MSQSQVRVRFAPSPTGHLHLGGARTALFNWLWARKHGGAFILRIDDTGQELNRNEFLDEIMESLRWLGLDWDEGPAAPGCVPSYFQSERGPIYRERAEQLIRQGHAYRCYATRDELRSLSQQYRRRNFQATVPYPGIWRNRADHPRGQPYVIRLKAPPEGSTCFVDRVKGAIEIPHHTLSDCVLIRSDGSPQYNFACVVDDIDMRITMVARGDDVATNTSVQILLYQAFGAPIPEFAHLPMVLSDAGQKMSKSRGATSMRSYRQRGFIPDAMLDYLAGLGWAAGDQAWQSRDALISNFDWTSVGGSAGRHDEHRLAHRQRTHLRRLSADDLADQLAPFLKSRDVGMHADRRQLVSAACAFQRRCGTLADLADAVARLLTSPPPSLTDEARDLLRELAELVCRVEPFQRGPLLEAITRHLAGDHRAPSDLARAARSALTGSCHGPALCELLEILGPTVVADRFQ